MKTIKKIVAVFMVTLIAVSAMMICPPMDADAAFVTDYQPYSDCVYMVNLETGMVVYEKNAEKTKYPASLTKIMTCLLVCEYYSDLENEKVTIDYNVMNDKTFTSQQVWSTTGLKLGERVRLIDLLYCALLPSDNYAALALAYKVSQDKGDGTIDWFIKLMNNKAAELGCTNTQFVNPHGLFNENHYSCAKDIFLISQYAMQIPVFAEIVGTDVPYKRPVTNMSSEPYRFETTNRLMLSVYTDLFYQYVKGIKTGFLKAAGHCFSCYAIKDGYSYIIVLMDDGMTSNRATDDNLAMRDAKTMLQWAFSDLQLKEVVQANATVAEVPLELAWNKDVLALVPSESFRTLLPKNVQSSSILVQTDIPDVVKAPVMQGEVIGSASLVYANEVIGTIDLVAGETVQRSELLYILSIINTIFESTAFMVILILLVLAAVVYVIYSLIHAQNVSSLKKVRRTVRSTGVWREGTWRGDQRTYASADAAAGSAHSAAPSGSIRKNRRNVSMSAKAASVQRSVRSPGGVITGACRDVGKFVMNIGKPGNRARR